MTERSLRRISGIGPQIARSTGGEQDALWIVSREGQILYANAHADGLAARVSDDFLSLIALEDRSALTTVIENREARFAVRTAEGRPIVGEVAYIEGDAVVLTVRGALRSSARARAVLQSIPDLVFEVTAEGRCVRFKSSFLGEPFVSGDRFLGRTVVECMPRNVADATMAMIETALRTRAVQRIEYRLARASGPRAYECRMTATDHGTVVAIVRDVTLERETQAKLNATNEALQQFTFLASHDLRAPLRAIGQLASFIEEDLELDDASETSAHIEDLKERVKRMDRVIESLLEYTRAGEIAARLENVSLVEVCELAVDTYVRSPSSERRASPRFHVEHQGLDKIMTARTPLERVVCNLIQNAVRHHDRDEGNVLVFVEDADEAYWRIDVQDDGPGIPVGLQARAFHLTQTLKPRQATQATGMGLAIVRRILESCGGAINVESPVVGGRGTRFSVLWPKQWPSHLRPSDQPAPAARDQFQRATSSR